MSDSERTFHEYLFKAIVMLAFFVLIWLSVTNLLVCFNIQENQKKISEQLKNINNSLERIKETHPKALLGKQASSVDLSLVNTRIK